MRVLSFVALLGAVGCTSENEHFPVNPGGGGGIGGGTGGEGSGSNRDGGVPLEGNLCLLTDLRNLTDCSTTGTGIVTVKLGGETVQTNSDGTFEIPTPTGSNLTWRVSGTGIRSTVMPFRAGIFEIPVMTTTAYTTLFQANGGLNLTAGSAVLHFVRGAASLEDVTVAAGGAVVRYDGTSATIWDTAPPATGSGPKGLAWIPELAVGDLTLTATPQTGTPQTEMIPIDAEATTFVTLDEL